MHYFYLRRYKALLYSIGTTKEVATLPNHLPEQLLTEIFTGLVVLDAEYESDRDYLQIGGYSLLVDNIKDIPLIKNHVDYDRHPPEWVTRIGSTGYLSALFIMNDDFSIMLYMPIYIAPDAILKDLED